MQPHNLTETELLTEVENRYPADPLISALVKMADDQMTVNYRETCDDVAEKFGYHSPESLREALASIGDPKTDDANQ